MSAQIDSTRVGPHKVTLLPDAILPFKDKLTTILLRLNAATTTRNNTDESQQISPYTPYEERLAIAHAFCVEGKTSSDVSVSQSLSQIPSLDSKGVHDISQFQPGCLVKCRALVQQTYDPEIYATSLELSRSSTCSTSAPDTVTLPLKYTDDVERLPDGYVPSDLDRSTKHLQEYLEQRRRVYCVPIPGKSSDEVTASVSSGKENIRGWDMAGHYYRAAEWAESNDTCCPLNMPLPWEYRVPNSTAYEFTLYDIDEDCPEINTRRDAKQKTSTTGGGGHFDESRLSSLLGKSQIDKHSGLPSSLMALADYCGSNVQVNDIIDIIGIFEGLTVKQLPKQFDDEFEEHLGQQRFNETPDGDIESNDKTGGDNIENLGKESTDNQEAVGGNVCRVHVLFHSVSDSVTSPQFWDSIIAGMSQVTDSADVDNEVENKSLNDEQIRDMVPRQYSNGDVQVGTAKIPRVLHKSNWEQQRSAMLALIAKNVTMDDRLSAEYLILFLVSSCFTRLMQKDCGDLNCRDETNFVLNLLSNRNQKGSQGEHRHGVSKLPLAASLESFLRSIGILAVGVPLSPSILRSFNFSPRWQVNQSFLSSGILQLAPKTVLVLDEIPLTQTLDADLVDGTNIPNVPETDKQSGDAKTQSGDKLPKKTKLVSERMRRLDEKGLQSLKELKELCASNQKLSCNFGNYSLPLKSDITTIVVSDRKPVLQSESNFITIPCGTQQLGTQSDVVNKDHNESTSTSATGHASTPQVAENPDFSKFGDFFHRISRQVKEQLPKISKGMATKITEDFVRHRQEMGVGVDAPRRWPQSVSKITADTLRLWLTLVLAECLLYGEEEVTSDRWSHVIHLEERRRYRADRWRLED